MTAFPLRYAHRNILLGRGDERAALYWIPTISYRYLTDSDKEREAGRLAQFAYGVRTDFALWRVCRQYPADRYAAQAEELLDDRYQDPEAWYEWLDGHGRRLAGLRAYIPEVYLAVSIRQQAEGSAVRGLKQTADRVRRRLEDLAGIGGAQPVPAAELKALQNAEEEVYGRVAASFPDAERASDDDIQWLIRRPACRALTEPMMDVYWRPNALMVQEGQSVLYTPLEADLVKHANAAITEEQRSLTVDAEEGTTYQTMLTFGAFPDDAEFPGSRAELLFAPLEACDFPVDASMHCQWISNREARSQVRKRILDVENAFSEQLESQAGAGWLAESDRDLARELEAYLQSEDHPPMLLATTTLAVSAEDPDKLSQRVTALREHYGQMTLHQPAGLQEQLFYLHLPQPPLTTKDYLEPLTIEQFGATMPVGDHRVGSPDGAYIAYTTGGGPRPVRWNPLEASRESRPSAILLAGTLGSGKSLSDATPIPSPDGWKTMGDLAVGDRVFDERGEPCDVLGVYPQPDGRECYEVVFSDGSTIVADAEHRWATLDLAARQARGYQARTRKRSLDHLGGTSRHRGVRRQGGSWIAQAQHDGKAVYLGSFTDEDDAARVAAAYRAEHLPPRRGEHRTVPQVLTTEQIRGSLHRWGQVNHAIPVTEPLAYPSRDLPIDPYVLGAWLGDGCSTWGTIHSADPEITEYFEAAGYPTTVHAVGEGRCPRFGVGGGFRKQLREQGLIRNKHVPDEYMVAGVEQRLALLQGLMDTDGSINAKTGEAEFSSTLRGLAEAVRELAVSLGMKARLREGEAKPYGRVTGPRYRVYFSPHLPVFRLPRKLARVKPRSPRTPRALRYIVDVRPAPSVPMRCIAVDSPSHLYLAGDAMIPTHNTLAAQNLALIAERRGSLIVDIDPKPDHNMHSIPEFAARSRLVELTGEEKYAGILDPLRIAPPEQREDVAVSYYLGAMRSVESGWQNSVARATRTVIERCDDEHQEPASLMVIDELRSMDERGAADALDLVARGGLGRLAFGEGDANVITQDVSLITIRAPGLQLPDPDVPRESYEHSERVSVATLSLLATFALHLVSQDRTRHKLVLFDEAWFLLASQAGRNLVNRLVRLGRAQNATLLIATQQLGDIGELIDLMGTVFLFGQKSDAEAQRGLAVLGLDADDSALTSRVREMRRGRCLMRDLSDRVAEVQIDVVFPHVLAMLDTSPQAERARSDQADIEAARGDDVALADDQARATMGATAPAAPVGEDGLLTLDAADTGVADAGYDDVGDDEPPAGVVEEDAEPVDTDGEAGSRLRFADTEST